MISGGPLRKVLFKLVESVDEEEDVRELSSGA